MRSQEGPWPLGPVFERSIPPSWLHFSYCSRYIYIQRARWSFFQFTKARESILSFRFKNRLTNYLSTVYKSTCQSAQKEKGKINTTHMRTASLRHLSINGLTYKNSTTGLCSSVGQRAAPESQDRSIPARRIPLSVSDIIKGTYRLLVH